MEREQLDNVITMLQSPDTENHILALAILEEQELSKTGGFLMLCFRFGIPDENMWKEHAPKCFKAIKTLGETLPYVGFSFQQIFNIVTQETNSIDELEIYFKKYGEFLTKQCKNPNIESIEINVKLKNNETK
jgi:hypothetical protein